LATYFDFHTHAAEIIYILLTALIVASGQKTVKDGNKLII